jgi:hypothetical protein
MRTFNGLLGVGILLLACGAQASVCPMHVENAGYNLVHVLSIPQTIESTAAESGYGHRREARQNAASDRAIKSAMKSAKQQEIAAIYSDLKECKKSGTVGPTLQRALTVGN